MYFCYSMIRDTNDAQMTRKESYQKDTAVSWETGEVTHEVTKQQVRFVTGVDAEQ
jgi:hypothetical protein